MPNKETLIKAQILQIAIAKLIHELGMETGFWATEITIRMGDLSNFKDDGDKRSYSGLPVAVYVKFYCEG